MARFSWHLDGVEAPQAVVATVDIRNRNARAAYAKMVLPQKDMKHGSPWEA